MYRDEVYYHTSIYTKIFIIIHIHMRILFMDDNQQTEIDSYYFGQTIGIESSTDNDDQSTDESTH